MCSIAVKSMKPRKRGAIVNIGSASATYLPTYPLYAVYAATKVRVCRAIMLVGLCQPDHLAPSLLKNCRR